MTPAAALDRLERSRDCLRQAMQPPTAGPGADAPRRLALFDGVNPLPSAAIVLGALLRRWSARHPLQLAGAAGIDALKTAVQPLAQRHPIGLVAGAALAGGVLVWSRPWRWAVTSALFASLLPRLVDALVHPPPR